MLLDRYEINNNTLAVIPIDSKLSKIIEMDNTYLINKKTTEIIDDSCRFFGSSFNGRHEGTKNLTGINYKSPIIIEETSSIIFFPTSSPRFDNCMWIALNNIENYIQYNDMCKIIFKNNEELLINISFGSLQNQILRATMLESMLRKRKISL